VRRLLLALALAFVASTGTSVRAQSVTASTALAVQHWTDAVMRHVPGAPDESVVTIAKMTMDDRKALNAGLPKLLGALAGRGSANSTAEKHILDIGLDLMRNPGMNAFL